MSTIHQFTYLKDYQPAPYGVDTVDLSFTLEENFTTVNAQLQLRAHGHDGTQLPLKLQGQGLELIALILGEKILSADEYQLNPEELIIAAPGAHFKLDMTVRIKPQENKSLMGLYTSNGNFCTQCEAEGMRKIIYYVDRPDNLAIFTVTIIADQVRYPVLLSNGNKMAQGKGEKGKHWVKWHDPFKKAGHLFALVAGDLACVEDHFITLSGRRITLQLFIEHGNVAQTAHAMHSLKQAMHWDEQRYGREYDLDIFMTVAVADFNMGAMENKGLNIFNSKYILADAHTATDVDFDNITRVVGHEYFHNWSGNRVGCRDWFQLSLKEGFTVFRDQSFTADLSSAAVKRINDVKLLRSAQFTEDAGPLAHAVRPEAYIEISNFYTLTIYEKGAELIRMLHTLLGTEGFRRATDLYFSRFDGQAVTTDDFIACMQEVSGRDLSQFQLWYRQAGTPIVTVKDEYDAEKQQYSLYIQQHTPATPGQTEKVPLLIPFEIGLLDGQGQQLATRLVELTHAEQRCVFTQIASQPVPSLLRNFSAPVKVHYAYSDAQLKLLLSHDSDAFNRWEAGQLLAIRQLKALIQAVQDNRALEVEQDYIETIKTLLKDDIEPAFKALLLTLPAQAYLADFVKPIDPLAIHHACEYLRTVLAQQLRAHWLRIYQQHHDNGDCQPHHVAAGKRALKNVALSYLVVLNEADLHNLAYQQYQQATNMTDRLAALSLLANLDSPQRSAAMLDFYTRFQTNSLVLDKWFAVQAASHLPNTLQTVKDLWQHPAFDPTNPNKVRALLSSFSKNNPVNFHQPGGAAYQYLADTVLHIDRFNPQIAARLIEPLTHWHRYKDNYASLMRAQLSKMLAASLSKDTYEIVAKALAAQ